MRRLRSFTLAEILVVMLIMVVLMGIATALFVSAQNDARKKQCRTFMQSIATMADEWRLRHISFNGATYVRAWPTTTAQVGETGPVPKCPTGGTYSLSTTTVSTVVRLNVTCSVASHGTFTYGIQSN
jgi:type II secretory pathway pseudopilin PulG